MTTQPISPDLFDALATAIEGATPPTLWPKPLFRRLRVQTPEGVEAALPSRSEPSRNRFFDIVLESGITSEKMTSDEDRFVLDYSVLIRIYYAEVVAIPGQGDKALLEARIKVADFVVLQRALIQANIFSPISGASSIVDAGAVFPPGLIEWRLNVTMEEATV
jgi:hypothetical protein